MKKDGIQTRNRKVTQKSKKTKSEYSNEDGSQVMDELEYLMKMPGAEDQLGECGSHRLASGGESNAYNGSGLYSSQAELMSNYNNSLHPSVYLNSYMGLHLANQESTIKRSEDDSNPMNSYSYEDRRVMMNSPVSNSSLFQENRRRTAEFTTATGTQLHQRSGSSVASSADSSSDQTPPEDLCQSGFLVSNTSGTGQMFSNSDSSAQLGESATATYLTQQTSASKRNADSIEFNVV
ncbi:hypothetical protein Ciccas_001443 [Cichlidogyrus casuarinus]|uniref:Uncharacterized protein n=1 Tax=Cichlidogyrus casuarinus TaxID=1844966 RepID=A0ABD2QK44_9PLAT